MNVTFDATKDAANRAKHGVSLADAENIEWDTVCRVGRAGPAA